MPFFKNLIDCSLAVLADAESNENTSGNGGKQNSGLYKEFHDLKDSGIKVKGWWIRQTAKKIMDELHPDVNFKMSNRWFQAFKSRYNISLRRPTHTAQKKYRGISRYWATISSLFEANSIFQFFLF